MLPFYDNARTFLPSCLEQKNTAAQQHQKKEATHDQMSEAAVNRNVSIASGEVHRTGNTPCCER
jgi:hypothetical protein